MTLTTFDKQQMRECAFAYLTKYKPSTGKLRNYLLQKQYLQADVEELIIELINRRYLNDYVLACKILQSYCGTKSRGRTSLRLILLHRGIETNSAELALNDFFLARNEKDLLADFLNSSCQLLFKDFENAACDKFLQRKVVHRITAKCLRRGFKEGDIKIALLKRFGDTAYSYRYSDSQN